jgi:Zn finger protein HypA/HybF involved in hydrogenase expression
VDIDIRPVAVDQLVQWEVSDLVGRRTRLEDLQTQFQTKVVALQEHLEEVQRIFSFIQAELKQVELAIRLVNEDIVRVICPTCKGTGMKPSDALSGQISKGSAFESVGKPNVASTFIAEHLRCTSCKGQRWTIMERYKG